jgi:hypothetical protein
VPDAVGAEARRIVHQAAGDASGLTIKGQIRQAARHLGYAADSWRVRDAWYGRAGSWNAAALRDLQGRFSRWRAGEGTRPVAITGPSALPMLALQVGAIRRSLSDLMRQVVDLEASVSRLMSGDAHDGDGGSSSDA